MRIAYCIPGLGPSGGVRVILEHCQRLANLGHDVVILTSNLGKTDWFGEFNVPIQPRAVAGASGWFDAAVATGHDTVYWVDTVPTDRLFWFMQMAEERFHPPESRRYHEDQKAYLLAKELGINVITIATWLANHLWDQAEIVAPVVPNGVNENHFFPQGRKLDYILLEGDGRNPAKDTESIAYRVGEALRPKHAVGLWGVAATVPPWSKRMDRFVFRPTVAQFRELYSGALFMLKTTKYEGRSLAPLEAMACGTPTCRGITLGDDDLVDGLNCRRRAYKYAEVLDAANHMLNDRQELRWLTEGALSYACDQLSWDPIIRQLEGYYGQA